MHKTLKKVLKITGISFLALLAIAFILPLLFKKQITNLVKSELNKSLVAHIDFRDVSLSLFRHFPKVSISVEEISIVGLHHFAGDTLLYAQRVDASAGLFNVLKGEDIDIHGLFLESPRIHAIVKEDGLANWDIAMADTTAGDSDSTASEFSMTLSKYGIHDGYIVYDDASTGTYAKLAGVEHSGSGDFTADVFTLQTKTSAESATLTSAGVPWLVNTKTDIETDIRIDNRNRKYSFETEDVLLNNLALTTRGFVQLVDDSTYAMDITFNTPANDFRDILSMVPGIYKKDFDNIKTSGEAAFQGFVKGNYSPVQMPAYDINLEVRNGSFQYPDLPKPVSNIQLDLHASNADGNPDNTVIDLSKGHLEMDNEPFDFRFLFRNPETVRYIDAAAKGKLDLSQLSQFIKLDEGTKLAGLVWADAFAKGNMQDMQEGKGAFEAGGFFDIKNLAYASAQFPQPIRNGNMKATIHNSGGIADHTSIQIESGHVELGADPVDFSLSLRKPMTDLLFNGAAKGRFNLGHLQQFSSLEPGSSLSGNLQADIRFAGSKAVISASQYDKLQLEGTASIADLHYKSPDYPTGISIARTAAQFNTSQANITEFAGNYLGSSFTGRGDLRNIVGYLVKGQTLQGNLDLAVDKMNLNDWMGTSEAVPGTEPKPASNTGATPFLVPANLDIQLKARAGNVHYDKVDYKNMNAVVRLENETVKLQDVKAEALDGTILLNGSYSTLMDKANPDIAMSYQVQDMDIQKAFFAYNTAQAIMPIGRFLSGKLKSELSMTGNLAGDMMPNLQSLTGKGNLLLLQGVLKQFGPLEKLAAVLDIDRLKSITLKDVRNYIEFANGKVLVQPFTINIDDIVMQIGGMHGFDNSIDYIVDMKLPRRYLGTAGNSLVDGLVTKATSKGIPIKLGEMIDLNVKMTGSISNPVVSVDLEKVAGNAMDELKEQAKDFAQEKMDSAKSRVKDTLSVIKDKAKEEVRDRIREQIFGKDTSKANAPADSNKPAQGVKDRLKGILKPRNND